MKTIEEMIAVMQHFAAGGKVEYKYEGTEIWAGVYAPQWNWTEYDYRIAAPKKKTIKLEAWLDNETGSLGHYVEDCYGITVPRFTRLPQLDITTEVEE